MVNVYWVLLMCFVANAEPANELSVDSIQTARSDAATTAPDVAVEQPSSPVHRYTEYDERPLPAIRRYHSATHYML